MHIFYCVCFLLMRWQPPRSTLTDSPFPYTPLFRSRNAAVVRPPASIGRVRAGFFGERKPLHLDIALHQRTEGARQLGADLAEPGLDISDDFGAALIIVGEFIFGILRERVHPVADRTLRITQLLERSEEHTSELQS